MLLASGVNFGFRRTLLHTLGISVGFCVLLLSVGLGLGTLFTALPQLQTALKVLGSLYMLYLAFRLARSRKLANSDSIDAAQPMTFVQAALFQWVNPKAWVMAVSSMALYTDPLRPYLSVLGVAAVFSLLNWPSCSVWVVFGQALSGFLSHPSRLQWFNIAMGVLLALSVVLIVQ